LKVEDCTLIEIKQPIQGFDRFIGAWVYQGDIPLVVDVGPANSVHRLVKALADMNVDRVDYVLITHIHIDHVGGLAGFLESFPMARVVCHDKAVKHLVDPSRLWEGSRQVLGKMADAYGPLRGVREGVCIPHSQADIKDLSVIETPGHAPHHLSFSYKGHLFAGEAGGNYLSVAERDYLRPATPPRFFLKVFLETVDRLTALEDQHMCYAHFGDAPSSREMLKRFRAQVLRWRDIVQKEMSAGSEDLITRCVDRLLEKDPNLRAFEFMDPDTQAREWFFIANSVRGYIGFLEAAAD
jgi:glyoxylase-like metal-dependent hydrolase (beta-lactamase superfamily II)